MKTRILILTILFSLIFISKSNAQNLYQTIKGKVVDKETQVSLIGATVKISVNDSLIGTVTNNDGYFRLEKVPVGRHSISISYISYKPVTYPEILVSTGKEVFLNIELTETVNTIEKVVVKAYSRKDKPLNSMATVSARTFSVEEAARYAGGFDDPARMASSFSGITTGSLQDNSIVIRGNAPKGVLWRLEGVPIPNPNHFAGAISAGGGFVTIFSGQILSNSDFFTGAFPAEYGNALAGVFDMNFRTGNNEKREYWFQAGVIGLDVGAEGPFIKGRKASYLFNYRYSTYGLLKSFLPKNSEIPEYQDLSFKLNFPTKKAGIFSLWGVGAIDNMTSYEVVDTTEWVMIFDGERSVTDMMPAAGGLTHKYIIGNKSYINTTVALTNYSGAHSRKRLDGNLNLQDMWHIDVTEQKITAHSFFNHKFGPRHTNRTGIIYNKIYYNIDLKASETVGVPMEQYVKDKGNSDLFQAYTQSKFTISTNLSANIGAHFQYFYLNGNYSVEPRAGVRWDLNSKHALSFGFGKHSQIEDLKVYLAEKNGETPNKNLDFSKALHFVLGYDWKITDNIRLKLETYYQHLYDVPVIADSSYSMINFHQQWFMNDALINAGKGKNYGIDLTFERFLKNGFYCLTTASLFKSKYTGGDGIERNSAYDRGFVANILAGKEFYFNKNPKKQRILGVNLKLTYMGGERLHPVLETASLQSKEIQYDYYNAYNRKAKPSVYVNLGISFRKNKQKYSSIWSLQILNLFSAASSNLDFYNYKEDKLDVFTTSVMIPSVSYKIEF